MSAATRRNAGGTAGARALVPEIRGRGPFCLDERRTAMAKTERKPDHGDEALYALRHSTAHVMAGAVLELFPDAKFGFGPPVADGFYYDFDLPRALTDEDLPRIEERMRAMAKRDVPFEHREMPVPEALDFFRERHQDYKVEQIEKLDKADEQVELRNAGVYAAHRAREELAALRPPREVRREHVRPAAPGRLGRGDWGAAPPRPLLDQADELPRTHQGLPVEDPQLPRAAVAHRRARHGIPLRTRRNAARNAAGARVHAGRLAHLLLVGPGAGGDREGVRPRDGIPPDVRVPRSAGLPVDAPGTTARHGRAMGQGGEGAGGRAGRSRSPVRRRRGRRGLLRAEDRYQGHGCDRPRVAGADHPDRSQPARAFRRHLRQREGRARTRGDDPPRALRQPRALRRRTHRALRRQLPALAQLGAGRDHPGTRVRAAVRGGAGDRTSRRRPPRPSRRTGG